MNYSSGSAFYRALKPLRNEVSFSLYDSPLKPGYTGTVLRSDWDAIGNDGFYTEGGIEHAG
ncbi:hypothetical protein [Paenibacillus chitinolyticus]|uniref:hypothetical protein n=1 Tax=Paenibacillus chitinolyticus TaxID=79263 RepID=UPI003D029349